MSQAGIDGVTLGVLADQIGMSKSGLFAHFKSKEEVQISLLEYTAEFANARVLAPAMKVEQGLPRLKALVVNWFGWAQRAGLPGGCPVAAGLFEYDDVEGAVRNKILDLEKRWRHLLTHLVREAVEAGHLDQRLDVEQFVWELSAIYLGHHAAHRFLRAADADRHGEPHSPRCSRARCRLFIASRRGEKSNFTERSLPPRSPTRRFRPIIERGRCNQLATIWLQAQI